MQFQKCKKSIICIYKNDKKSIFAPEKSFRGCSPALCVPSFKKISGAKIDFLPFLKLHFFLILEHYVPLGGCPFRQKADISSSVLEVEVSSGKSSLVFDPAPVNSASI